MKNIPVSNKIFLKLTTILLAYDIVIPVLGHPYLVIICFEALGHCQFYLRNESTQSGKQGEK